ncbi:MAG TPA: GWxTD domain-containing protein [Thermoanaerobaculia bacterium]|nr:GWxTD domain-containing protein [Thermoanaerobaculia bacterium]
MRRGACVAAWFLAMALASGARGQPVPDSEDWADSPEAYFLTAEERADWSKLDSRDSRGAFRERYWLKRDPTPGTERNEFREVVLARIKIADQRFGIEKTPGSRTARGYVFVIFGSPAHVQDTHAPAPERPRSPASTVGALEGTETLSRWIYDRDRTPRILEALGVPSFQVEIMIEPSRHSDSIQSPGLVKEMRERLAKKSIVNPDLITASSSEPVLSAGPATLPRASLDASTRALLEQAPSAFRSGDAVFGDAVIWRDSGGAETLVWFYLPPSPGAERRFLQGVVRKENGGEEIASLSEPVTPTDVFSAAAPGQIILRRLSLPPGTYDAAFAVTEGAAARAVASASARLVVPDPEHGFAVSPLLLSRGPGARTEGDEASPFVLGQAVVPPRADATFSKGESLWFFLEVANAPDPAKVTLEIRLRRGTEPVSSRPPFPAQLEPLPGKNSLCGFELPLATLAPGDYRLYVLVRDGLAPADQYVLRSADFRIR